MTRWHLNALGAAALLTLLAGGGRAQPAATGASAPAAAADLAAQAAQSRLDKATQLLAEGNPKAALEQLADLRRDATLPIWLQVRAALCEGQAQYALGDYKATNSACVKVVDLTTVPAGQVDWPERPAAMLLLADSRHASGLNTSSREAYREVIERAPHSPQRMAAERSLIYMDLADGRLDAAGAAVDAYVKNFPWDQEAPRLIEDLGRELLARDKPAAAIERFRQVERDYAGTDSAWTVRRPLTDAFLANKQPDDALALVDQVLAIRPEMIVAHEAAGMKADLLVAKGDVPAALAVLDQFITKYADCYVGQRLRLQKADIRAAAGDLTGAAEELNKLLTDFPQPYWQVATLPGLIGVYRALKDWDKAEDSADTLAKLTAGTAVAAQALLDKAEIQYRADRKRAAGLTLDRLLATYKGAPFVAYASQLKAEWK